MVSCCHLNDRVYCNNVVIICYRLNNIKLHIDVDRYKMGFSVLVFCADKLPLSIRVLLEAAIRNCDGFYTKEKDVENILDWQQQQNKVEVAFTPARVLLQDFT